MLPPTSSQARSCPANRAHWHTWPLRFTLARGMTDEQIGGLWVYYSTSASTTRCVSPSPYLSVAMSCNNRGAAHFREQQNFANFILRRGQTLIYCTETIRGQFGECSQHCHTSCQPKVPDYPTSGIIGVPVRDQGCTVFRPE